MLDTYFKYPAVLRRMRCGPLAEEIDEIASDLERAGYDRLAAKRYLSLTATFSRYASQAGCVRARMIDRALVERFLDELPLSASTASVARTALGHVLRYLARRYPRPVQLCASERRESTLLAGFDSYLRDVRGLEVKSREELLRAARRTLAWYRLTKPGQAISRLSPKDVLAYAAHAADRCVAQSTRSATMSHLRGFLRYLHWSRACREDLSRHVPRVPIWRMARIPDHLLWEDVRQLVDSVDPSSPVGKRDRALLLLVATTGIRNSELRRLEMCDIRWRQGEVHLRQTKSRRGRVVPLVKETGSALAEYILHGRPTTVERRIFLSHRPPVRPFRISSAVSAIVRRRLVGLGGACPRRVGTHLLRHSIATQMVRQERAIKEVADLLGHQHIDTTAVYVKVALPQLATIALPFAGCDV